MTQPPLAAWGQGQVVRTLPSIRQWLVQVELGSRLCVARNCNESEASLRWLMRAFELAERAGLRVPKMIPASNGCLSASGWSMETWLPGRTGTNDTLKRARIPLARFHRLARSLPNRPGHPAMCHRPSLPVSQSCFPRDAMTVVHGDLHPGNLIEMPGGQIGLIDWEEARRDSVEFDHMQRNSPLHLAYEIAACWRDETDHARHMSRRFSRMARPTLAG